VKLLEARKLVLARGDDALATALVRDVPFVAVSVEIGASFDTEAGLERTGRVVDARVDVPLLCAVWWEAIRGLLLEHGAGRDVIRELWRSDPATSVRCLGSCG